MREIKNDKLECDLVAGVDIGGSHITVSLVNLVDYSQLPGTYIRKRVDSGADSNVIIKEWCDAIKESFGDLALSGKKIGIAVPGPFDYKKGISYMKGQGKYDALYGLDLKELIAEELGVAQNNIRFNNDAACFLQGEIYNGDLTRYSSAIGITLGTGLGSAFMRNNAAFDAALWDSPFGTGIIEDCISSRWFVSEFEKQTDHKIKDVKELVEKFPVHDVTKRLFEEFSTNLSVFLYKFLKQQKAEVIVIGGNIAKASDFFLRRVQEKLYQKMGYSVPVYLSVLGEDAALVGGASQFYTKVKNQN